MRRSGWPGKITATRLWCSYDARDIARLGRANADRADNKQGMRRSCADSRHAESPWCLNRWGWETGRGPLPRPLPLKGEGEQSRRRRHPPLRSPHPSPCKGEGGRRPGGGPPPTKKRRPTIPRARRIPQCATGQHGAVFGLTSILTIVNILEHMFAFGKASCTGKAAQCRSFPSVLFTPRENSIGHFEQEW